ncbi:hypothetical protein [Tumebacillus lipolyticus]|uniref:Two-component sensor histidine kinase n=1 Tax=Tumebacillus lipolyticus TaxID=1280370 RepID=A0ABW4ZRX1_9BACL
MFTKLRNRFLVLNLVTISFMMLLAFAAIYMMTYQNVQQAIRMELDRVVEFYNKPGDPRQPKGDHPQQPPDAKHDSGPERSVAFTIVTDKSWNRLSVSSLFTLEDSFYNNALQIVTSE